MATKIWAISEDGLIQFQQLTPKYLNSACDVIINALFMGGSANKTLGIPNDPEALAELDRLSRETAKDGVSVVAIDRNNDKVAGVAFNKIMVKSEAFLETFAHSLKNPKSRQILDFIIETENACNLYDLCQVDCVMEIFLLGTSPEYRKQGIARKLCELSVEIAQKLFDGCNIKQPMDHQKLKLEPTPKAVTAIFNSYGSQRIGRQLGFEIATERSSAKVDKMGRVLKIAATEAPTTTVEYKKLERSN